MITSDMSQEEEQEYINESLSALTRSIGHRPVGWLGPEYGESFRTPQLLARAGVRYVCDWPNDEQPYPIKTPEGELVALPLMLELDDVAALAHRRVAVDRYAEMLKDGFDVMYQDGKQNGRVLGLNLHPRVLVSPSGSAHRSALPDRLFRRGSSITTTLPASPGRFGHTEREPPTFPLGRPSGFRRACACWSVAKRSAWSGFREGSKLSSVWADRSHEDVLESPGRLRRPWGPVKLDGTSSFTVPHPQVEGRREGVLSLANSVVEALPTTTPVFVRGGPNGPLSTNARPNGLT